MGLRSDVVSILSGFGSVRVVHSTGETRGVLDDAEAEQQLGDGSTVAKRGRLLRIPAAALPTLVAEDSLDVGDPEDDETLVTYRVLDTLRESDGLIWRLFLA
ncbi:MAG TPA: hypothetical protein VGQ24_15875 [Gemmatimonadales bacterium]|jgi:hypothetical protein|nr:hypothetical protein [Gemmatimonadales bacterium]